MASFASGTVQIGTLANPIEFAGGDSFTWTHNSGKKALAASFYSAQAGQEATELDGFTITQNNSNELIAENPQAGVPLYDTIIVFIVFQVSTPTNSGSVPASAVVVS